MVGVEGCVGVAEEAGEGHGGSDSGGWFNGVEASVGGGRRCRALGKFILAM